MRKINEKLKTSTKILKIGSIGVYRICILIKLDAVYFGYTSSSRHHGMSLKKLHISGISVIYEIGIDKSW